MGMLAEVIKSGDEDNDFAYYIYKFALFDEKLKYAQGKIKINKQNGDVITVEQAEGDGGSFAKCAGWALMRHWKKSEYPDRTYWES